MPHYCFCSCRVVFIVRRNYSLPLLVQGGTRACVDTLLIFFAVVERSYRSCGQFIPVPCWRRVSQGSCVATLLLWQLSCGPGLTIVMERFSLVPAGAGCRKGVDCVPHYCVCSCSVVLQ